MKTNLILGTALLLIAGNLNAADVRVNGGILPGGIIDDKKLLAVFSQFDTDNSGKITEENIHLSMQKLGMEVPKSEIRTIIQRHILNTQKLG